MFTYTLILCFLCLNICLKNFRTPKCFQLSKPHFFQRFKQGFLNTYEKFNAFKFFLLNLSRLIKKNYQVMTSSIVILNSFLALNHYNNGNSISLAIGVFFQSALSNIFCPLDTLLTLPMQTVAQWMQRVTSSVTRARGSEGLSWHSERSAAKELSPCCIGNVAK